MIDNNSVYNVILQRLALEKLRFSIQKKMYSLVCTKSTIFWTVFHGQIVRNIARSIPSFQPGRIKSFPAQILLVWVSLGYARLPSRRFQPLGSWFVEKTCRLWTESVSKNDWVFWKNHRHRFSWYSNWMEIRMETLCICQTFNYPKLWQYEKLSGKSKTFLKTKIELISEKHSSKISCWSIDCLLRFPSLLVRRSSSFSVLTIRTPRAPARCALCKISRRKSNYPNCFATGSQIWISSIWKKQKHFVDLDRIPWTF